jgi:hypothetical protein
MLNVNRVTEVKSMRRKPGAGRRLISRKAAQIILWLFIILETFIALRTVLKLIGANPENLIVVSIYGLTAFFLIPFAGLVASPMIGGMVLEISSMFAITVYALIAVAFNKLTMVLSIRPRSPVANITETTIIEKHTTR